MVCQTQAKHLRRYISKNLNKPSIIIHGDIVRKYISHDLGYDLSDRKFKSIEFTELKFVLDQI